MRQINENLVRSALRNSLKKLIAEQENKGGITRDKFLAMHRRCRNLNEDVMRRYWNIRHQSAPILLEKITIDRLMHKHGDNGFTIISANRSDQPEERNTKANQSLIQDLKNSGFSYLPTYGGYKGTDGVTDEFEPSFVVFNYDENGNPTQWDDLYRFSLDMCSKYEQDSVYIQAPGQAPEWQDEEGNKVNSRSSRDYIKNDLTQPYFTSLSSPEEIAAHGKTQPVGRRFTSDIEFESKIYVNPLPSSITARRRRKGEIFVCD